MVAGGGGRDSNLRKKGSSRSKRQERSAGKGCLIRGGGGGIRVDGEIGIRRIESAKSFENGAAGGIADNSDAHYGGFGGGGYCGGGGGYFGGDADFVASSNGSCFSKGGNPIVEFKSISNGKCIITSLD